MQHLTFLCTLDQLVTAVKVKKKRLKVSALLKSITLFSLKLFCIRTMFNVQCSCSFRHTLSFASFLSDFFSFSSKTGSFCISVMK